MSGIYKIIHTNGKETNIKLEYNSEKEIYDNYYTFVRDRRDSTKIDIPNISFSPVYYNSNINTFNYLKEYVEHSIKNTFEITEISTPNLIENTAEIKALQKLFGLDEFAFDNKYVLPPASDFGIFSFLKDKDIIVENIGNNVYQFANCYRIEDKKKQNNVLIRPTCFHLPDIHSFLNSDIYQAVEKHLLFYSQILDELNIDYNFALRITEKEYTKYKKDIIAIVKKINKDLIINIVPSSIRYWESKFKFLYRDTDGNYVQLSTVQVDYNSSKIFNIKMKGNNMTILHSSIGSLERLMYAYLEKKDD